MKVMIVYYSAYNKNTEKIAECMAEQFGGDLIKSNDFNATDTDIEKYDLIGFGSGIYDQKMHPSIFKAIEKSNLQNKNTFVFSTSSVGFHMFNKDAKKLLLTKGAKVVGSFACKGFFTAKLFNIFVDTAKGHPNNGDFQNVKRFTESILNEIN